MQILTNPISALNTRIAEISASCKKSGSSNTIVTSDFRPEMEIRPFRACAMEKICNITLIYGGIAEIFAS